MDIKKILKESVGILEVAERLGLNLKKYGQWHQGHCPTGHDSEGGRCFSIKTESNFYYCFHCGEVGDIFSLVMIARNYDFKDAPKWLVDEFRPDLSSELLRYNKNEQQQNEQEQTLQEKEYYEKASLYEILFEYGKNKLYQTEGEGRNALDYLINGRGYNNDVLRRTEWMYFPPEGEIRKFISAQYPKLLPQLEKTKLQGYFGDNFRLALPYRNRQGIITGFSKRSCVPKGITITTYDGKTHEHVRWDSTLGLKKDDLFNLHACRGESKLIILEGYPDALYLPALGLKNVVAVAQGTFSKTYLQGLKAHKVQRVVIAFDNDLPKENGKITGIENTEKALEVLSRTDLKVFVIDPPLLAPYKDPDEFVSANGIEAFKKLIDEAITAAKWKAQRIAKKYNPANDTERQNALEEAIDYADKGLRDRLDRYDFFTTIGEALRIPHEIIEEQVKAYSKQRARKQLEKGYEHLLIHAGRLLRDGKFLDVDQYLTERARELRLDYEKIKAEPVTPLLEHLWEKYDREKQREGGLLGHNLRTFKNIAKYIDGIQPGFYILAAETNVGKTAFLTNLFIDILAANPLVRGIYFSLDDSKDVIINRFLSILSNINLNQIQRKQSTPQDQETLQNAYSTLAHYVMDERLEIKDLSEIYHINMLELAIRKQADKNLVVFIDGLYNLEIDSNRGGPREENIDRANKVKALVDTYRIPVICTGEVRKRTKNEGENKPPSINDIMETGKIAYNANLVWLLYPEDQRKFKDMDNPILKLEFAKNKLSYFKGHQNLVFFKQVGRLKEDDSRI